MKITRTGRRISHVKADGSRRRAFPNRSGKCPSHAGSEGTKLGSGWDRDNPYREEWTRPAWKQTGDKRRTFK